MNKKLKTILGTATGSLLGALLVTQIIPIFTGSSPEDEMKKTFVKLVEELNKKTPIIIDSETSLTKVELYNGNAGIIYTHTLVNNNAEDISADLLREEVFPIFYKENCSNKEVQASFNTGAEFAYKYQGKDGIVIATALISKNVCDNL